MAVSVILCSTYELTGINLYRTPAELMASIKWKLELSSKTRICGKNHLLWVSMIIEARANLMWDHNCKTSTLPIVLVSNAQNLASTEVQDTDLKIAVNYDENVANFAFQSIIWDVQKCQSQIGSNCVSAFRQGYRIIWNIWTSILRYSCHRLFKY